MSNIKLREEKRISTNNPWVFPTPKAWSDTHIFISTPFYNYTYRDYQQFFNDINFEDGWFMWNDSKELLAGLPAPGVEVYCLFGTGYPTPETYIYNDRFPYEDPVDIIYGDGDELVSWRSIELCKEWRNQQYEKVHVLELPGAEHLNMIFDNRTLQYISEILFGNLENVTAAQDLGGRAH